MCGIIGYIGNKPAQPILLNGLARMEYRGYDSAGVATLHDGRIHLLRAKGKVSVLKQKIDASPLTDTIGVGHTRWATHGEPNERNAHPHVAGKIALVHNGIIENYQELKVELVKEGAEFASATDTEVLAHLINYYYTQTNDFVTSVQLALQRVRGTFGLAVACADDEQRLIAARRGSPLQIGIGAEATFVTSDNAALVGHAKDVIYLEDDQMAVCSRDSVDVLDFELNPQEAVREELTMELGAIQKQGYDHFLLKEIMEQPASIEAVLRGRLMPDEGGAHLGGLNMTDQQIRQLERIILVACGTASYAALLGKYQIEKLTGIPVDVEIASELRYRDPVIGKHSVAIAISQSGETADTLACVEELKRRGVHTLGLVNVVGSTIARAVDGGIYLHAGPEISVASTKAYTNMAVALLLFALYVGRRRNVSLAKGQEVIAVLQRLPKDIEAALEVNNQVKKIAKKVSTFTNAFYLGRDTLFPVALEGAIKMKEISYLHAEAYPAGEAKHGPLALVDSTMLIVFLLGKGPLAEKALSNLQEMKTRGGNVLLITDTKTEEGMHTIHVATHSEWTAPLVLNIPQQLLAYHTTVALGRDVDQPRNLAKSVTVE
ncbi:MAG TPA: glutamine--fructose-6-phosphate transaminase (isomerizing) [Candidatus Saccharimonadales bacterium]|nr:glutamine--fructose-6-phosphate transaminase (isomerizing) [Candidatus Saccharimonadales bacterium]